MKQYLKSVTVNIADESSADKLDIARNPDTNPEVLEELLKDSNGAVVNNVLANPSTPTEVLIHYLVTSPKILNLEAIAANPSITPAIINELVKFDTFSICISLLRNPNTPSAIIDKIVFGHPDNTMFLQQAANNPKASERVHNAYKEYITSITIVKQQIAEYLERHIRNKVAMAIEDLDNDDFQLYVLEQKFPKYDTEWCTGDVSEKAAQAFEDAISKLVEYELTTLFEGVSE